MFKTENKIGTYAGHPTEIVTLNPNDVIVVHLCEGVDWECANEIVNNMQKVFPNNPVIFKHPLLIEGISIMGQREKINYEQPFLSTTGGKDLW